MRQTFIYLIIFFNLCIIFPLFGGDEVPILRQRVTDQSGVLSRGESNDLEKKLEQFEKESSTQIAVLIVESLGGEDITDYTFRVAEKNQLGKKGKDNGILIVIAIEERKIRIEVGYGLEGALTDALSSQIIRNRMAPHFRSGNYYEGILDGITAIIEATKGEYRGEDENENIRISPFVVFIILIIVSMIIRGLIRSGGQYIGSGKYKNRYPWWWGGFGGGGFGGGGFSGRGFGGGGGFSGGGGRFGGGGATGGW